jgi:peptide/nickel transport system ATP-binding protein
MRSVPRLDEARVHQLETIEGLPPDLLAPPPGCRFAPRCPFRIDICEQPVPAKSVSPGHTSSCHRVSEVAAGKLAAPAAQQAATTARKLDHSQPLLEVEGLKKYFYVKIAGTGLLPAETATVRAVDDVSFGIAPGETLGLVGESGCGKTTVGRVILKLDEPTAGSIRFDGTDIAHRNIRQMRELRRKIQVIFQDPYSSLNPRMTVGEIIGEPLHVYRLVKDAREQRDRIAELLNQVGLFPYMAERYPHELSGGQRQRVGIARALALEPNFIVCDEPVSALDVSIQGQIINLLVDLQARLGLTYLFIAHDLAVVRHISDRVVVMYLGRIMEIADRETLYSDARHPYTQALLAAVPVPDPAIERARQRTILAGEVPSPLRPPSGCVFRTRCPMATEECKLVVPELKRLGTGHFAACIKL